MPTITPNFSDATRPEFGQQYELWLNQNCGILSLAPYQNNYKIVTEQLRDSFTKSSFWTKLLADLKEVDDQYTIDFKFPLISTFSPDVLIKPWNSLIEKSFRRNVAQNTNFPEPPDAGWVIPPEWFSLTKDIVRTSIIVKYIDGVPLVLKKLIERAQAEKLDYEHELQTREDGYYGAHFNLHLPCSIPTMAWETERREIIFEIQITTQIKDVIKRLLHSYYEDHRVRGKKSLLADIAWNYKDDEFVATYLGHILHYVEGMIIEARDRRRERNA